MGNRKITRADVVTIPSFVLPRGDARSRDLVGATPLVAQSDGRFPRAGADSAGAPHLPYDFEALRKAESSEFTPERKLDYDIPALPGRQRFHITENGREVIPSSGTQGLVYYGVSKKQKGTNISRLSAEMIPVIGEMAAAAQDLGLRRPVITAGSDGRHKRGSLHYRNRGLDFRGNDITDAEGRRQAKLVQVRLGEDYDILFEQPNGKPPAHDHFHTEFDPPSKRR